MIYLNYIKMLSICVLLGVAFLFTVYSVNVSSETKDDPTENVLNDQEGELIKNEIIKIIKGYWNLSLEENTNEMHRYIRQAPESFWTRCSIENEKYKNTAENFDAPMSKDSAGEGSVISENEKRAPLFLLEYFSDQIAKAKPELLDVKVIRFTQEEAVARLKWKKREETDSESNETFLVQKIDGEWKIIMIENGSTNKNIFRVFGTNDQCLPKPVNDQKPLSSIM